MVMRRRAWSMYGYAARDEDAGSDGAENVGYAHVLLTGERAGGAAVAAAADRAVRPSLPPRGRARCAWRTLRTTRGWEFGQSVGGGAVKCVSRHLARGGGLRGDM